jgi:hypothetical protein
MIKTLLLTFFSVFCFSHFYGQTSLFERTWAYNEKIMHLVDSTANKIRDQSFRFKRKKAKTKSRSSTNKKVKHIIKVRYKKGNCIVREIFEIGSECKIKVLRINGQIQMISSKFYRKGYGSEVNSNFINLGNRTWQWTYISYENIIRTYKSETVRNWR